MIDQAMLMAAGLGTRLRPFTDVAAKPLLPLLGVPMAQFALDQLAAAGVRKIVANVHHLPDATAEGLRKLELGGAELSISDESRELLGSAGGIRKALPCFGSKPFFLVNADVISEVDLAALGRAHERLRSRWGVKMTMALLRRSPGSMAYRELHFDEATGLITRAGDLGVGVPFYVGSAVIEPEAVAHLPEGPSEFVPSILGPLIAEGKAGSHLASGRWHDVGSPELWLNAHLAILEAMETGALSPLIRRRVESVGRRVGQRAWTARASRSPRLMYGPSYWAGTHPPREFGPEAVVYGDAALARGGIAYGGKTWIRPNWN